MAKKNSGVITKRQFVKSDNGQEILETRQPTEGTRHIEQRSLQGFQIA